ncbi:MAG: peroxiredoxin [Sulfurimonas sp.]|jgi:peroxiredoxin
MHLENLPLDIGYASEKVTLRNMDITECILGGHNGKTQLIITTPLIDDAFLEELKIIDKILPKDGNYEVTASLVVANNTHKSPSLDNFDFYIDDKDELADFYGLRLKGEPYNDELTKAIILISKDGAIFYDDFVLNIDDKFNIDTLYRKIAAAQVCYTGKGCH